MINRLVSINDAHAERDCPILIEAFRIIGLIIILGVYMSPTASMSTVYLCEYCSKTKLENWSKCIS